MKKLLIVTNTMGRAGAEKSLIALLRVLDYSRVTVHLRSIVNKGELFADVPPEVVILNKSPRVIPVLGLRSTLGIGFGALGRMCGRGIKCLPDVVRRGVKQVRIRRVQPDKLLWPVLAETTPLPPEEYDLAMAFIEGAATYYVSERVKAKTKIAFVHVNYEKAGYDRSYDARYYERMDYICCISEGIKRALCDVYPEYVGKIRLFPNIIDPTLVIKGAALPGGFKNAAEEGSVRLLTVARLHPQKGLDMAIEAMAKLVNQRGYSRLQWYIVGDGMERAYLSKLIKKHSLENNFILMGAMENPYPFIQQCDIYVQPSEFEGLSLTLLEALLLGKPCITTNFDGMPDLLVDGRDALIVSFSADQMADAIARLADDSALRDKLSIGTKSICFQFPNEADRLYALMNGDAWQEASGQ